MDEACVSGSDAVTVALSVLSTVLAVLALVVSLLAWWRERRQERRDFAAQLDEYARWYTESVMTPGRDPGPTFALSRRGAALESHAARLKQPGAGHLTEWALGLLNAMRMDSSGMRPFEEMQTISLVASDWVTHPRRLRKTIAAQPPIPAD